MNETINEDRKFWRGLLVIFAIGMMTNILYLHQTVQSWSTTTTTIVQEENRTKLCMRDCTEQSYKFFGINEELYPGKCWCYLNESWVGEIWNEVNGNETTG
jgi:hypothetical protein